MNETIKLFEMVNREYVQPEVERRRSNGELDNDFKVHECLIKLPGDRPPIILFNKECGWSIKPRLAPGVEMQQGQLMYLHDIVEIEEVLPPTVDGRRVTFIYLFWNGTNYTIMVDPYHPVHFNNPFDKDGVILAYLRNYFKELAVKNTKTIGERLHQIGLWPVTSLLPYPISKIVERIGEGEPDKGRQVLLDYCDAEFLATKIVATWKPIVALNRRHSFFDDALLLHENERFHGSISILTGQIEGVITDWLFEIDYYTEDKRRHIREKIEDFRLALDKIPDLLWLYREARDSMLNFLNKEPWLQRFELWNQDVNSSFPGRHVVQHGKYASDMFTQENSIKMFLMLDTICQFMMFYEARVLQRDLMQSAKGDE